MFQAWEQGLLVLAKRQGPMLQLGFANEVVYEMRVANPSQKCKQPCGQSIDGFRDIGRSHKRCIGFASARAGIVNDGVLAN